LTPGVNAIIFSSSSPMKIPTKPECLSLASLSAHS
jgi:hypothetical protein